MFKKLLLSFILICLVVVPVLPAQAQGNIAVSASSVQIEFPSAMVFTLSAQSTAPIIDIRLRYSVDHLGFASVISEAFVTFTPATSVTTQWKWDMVQSGGLPPGSVVHFYWIIADAAGERISTSSAEVPFDDTRFNWKSITEGKLTIFWYDGAQSFGQEIMSSAQQSLVSLSQSTGATPSEDVRIYIYANSSDLRGSMIFPQEWTGGVAFTEYGCIAIGISASNLAWGKRAIAHELTHLVTHQMTLNPYNSIPTWLEEGLAMYNEGPMEVQFTTPLNKAILNHSLLSLKTLSSPFSSYADLSYLSYAESHSAVDYLVRTYGRDKIFRLLEAFRKGNTYDGALLGVYGFNTKGLNDLWQQFLYSGKATGVLSGDNFMASLMPARSGAW